jgi:ubiquinone/menaquinone biosynthesis C-methylase UbiE
VSLPPDIYDREYFLSEWCEGFDRYQEDRGLSPIKQKQLALLEPGPGLDVLDAGCGRGEFLLACARAGARVAGMDYSQAAVELTRELLADVDGADIRQADVTELPWPDASFDRVLFADVIEHLTPEQADGALREFRRVLRPGGRLLVHTAPNRLFIKVSWPLMKPVMRLTGRGEAVESMDAWLDGAARYHINEQTVGSMRRAIGNAGFERPRVWIDPDVLRGEQHHLTGDLGGLAKAVARIARLRPVRLFLGNDLFGLAERT